VGPHLGQVERVEPVGPGLLEGHDLDPQRPTGVLAALDRREQVAPVGVTVDAGHPVAILLSEEFDTAALVYSLTLVGHLKVAEGAATLGMGLALRDALPIEVRHLLDEVVSLQQDRAVGPHGEGVLVAHHRIPASVVVGLRPWFAMAITHSARVSLDPTIPCRVP
jgi:hypothetical protein